MKKALAITLAAVMVAGSLAGCGNSGNSETTAQTTAAANNGSSDDRSRNNGSEDRSSRVGRNRGCSGGNG